MSDERNFNQDIPETQITSQEVVVQEKSQESNTPSTPNVNLLDAITELIQNNLKNKAMQEEIDAKQKQLDEERKVSDLYYTAGRYVSENLGSTEVSRTIFEDIRKYTKPVADNIAIPLKDREEIIMHHARQRVEEFASQKQQFEMHHRANHDRVIGLLTRNYGEYGKDLLLSEVRANLRFGETFTEEEADNFLYTLNHDQLERLVNRAADIKGLRNTKTPIKKK